MTDNKFLAIMGLIGNFFFEGMIAFSLLFAIPSFSQISLTQSFPCSAQNIAIDNLGNIYVVSPQNELSLYLLSGEKLFHYNENTQGELSNIDVTNPLQILLFYRNLQTITILDRTLSEQARLNLLDLDFPSIVAIGASRDNQIWLYDDSNFRLKKMNTRKEITATSENLSLILPSLPHPDQIIAIGNYVFLIDKALGVLLFDAFAQYYKTIPWPAVSQCFTVNEHLACRSNDNFMVFDAITGKTFSIDIPQPPVKCNQVFWWENNWITYQQDSIKVYTQN